MKLSDSKEEKAAICHYPDHDICRSGFYAGGVYKTRKSLYGASRGEASFRKRGEKMIYVYVFAIVLIVITAGFCTYVYGTVKVNEQDEDFAKSRNR